MWAGVMGIEAIAKSRAFPVGAELGLGGIPTINDNAVFLLATSHTSRASPAPT
ncbi:hypothetical protein ALP94_00996 [Pseudomonas savastanoi pv. glycinea]|nr:hypothetical protein ALP94_00996 [Pseudomonas savastanoi pv. glycinea]